MAKLRRSDSEKESRGVWVEYEGIRLLIARMGNPDYETAINAAMAPLRKAARVGALSEQKVEELSQRAMAKHILVGWENMEDEAGNAVPYSSEKALELLSNREYRDFYRFVLFASNDAELYRRELIEDAKGNLPAA